MTSRRSAETRAATSPGGRGLLPVVFVVVAATGAADHDLVLFDRDLDGAVTRPVLGVHGVVLHGRVEPQPVALLAVVERRLQGTGRAGAARGAAPAAARPAPAAARAARARGRLVLLGLAGVLVLVLGLIGGGLGRRGGGLELGGDQGVVLGAEVDLLVALVAVRAALEVVLALEGLDLLNRD